MPHIWARDLAVLLTERLVPLVGSILCKMRGRLSTASQAHPEVEINEGLASTEPSAHLLPCRVAGGAWE